MNEAGGVLNAYPPSEGAGGVLNAYPPSEGAGGGRFKY